MAETEVAQRPAGVTKGQGSWPRSDQEPEALAQRAQGRIGAGEKSASGADSQADRKTQETSRRVLGRLVPRC
jgi:hypothetical protein